MQVYSDGQSRVIRADFPKRFKLYNAGVPVSYLRTGKDSIRLSGKIPVGVLDVEEVIKEKAVKPARLDTSTLAIINKDDFDRIDILNKKLAINQEQMNSQLSVLTEKETTIANLETQNAKSIEETNSNIVKMAKAIGKEIQADRDSLVKMGETFTSSLSETGKILSDKIESHEKAKNPHKITKATIGLERVDNTSDDEKPISKAVKKALGEKADKTEIEDVKKDLKEAVKKQERIVKGIDRMNLVGGVGGNELPIGGKKGQVLTKKTNKDGDYEWSSTGGGVTVHNDLTGRSSEDAHPISAITGLQDALTSETTNRENADNGLQIQIDAITASSDVKDIVGTYAQLQAYDTSTLGNNDIIKVLQDETHSDETTYYRWSTSTETFTLIGEEGPYYTKSEANSTFVPQTRTVNGKALSSDISLTASDVGALPDTTVVPTINSSNNYVPYRSGSSTFSNSTLMYNSNAMAFTGRLHIGSSSPASYYNKGTTTIYNNTPSQQVTSLALLNYGGGGGCGVAVDMYNTSANGGIPSGRFGVIDNGNYSGYLQLQVKKSGAASNPLLPAMNIVPVPATSSLTTCVSFGQDEFNRVLFDLHKPEAGPTLSDSSCRWGGSGTTYSVTGNNKFNPRLLVAVGDIVSFNNFSTEARVVSVVSSSTTCQITTDVSLGSVSSAYISVKKAYFKITDESYNTKLFIDPYGKFGVGTGSPAYDLDVSGTINASTDVKINGSSVALVSQIPTDNSDLTNGAGYITGITSSDVTTALGYTPYNSTNPSGYQENVIETVKVNGTALTPSSKAVDITVPTVNNPTITLTQGGVTKGSFTLNQSTGDTIDLDAIVSCANTDLSNLTATGKETAAGLSMPSNKYESLTLGASGSFYTAPANGYVFLNKNSNDSNQFVALRVFPSNMASFSWIPTSGVNSSVFIPVKKGESFTALYNAGGTTNQFMFVYAEGDNV